MIQRVAASSFLPPSRFFYGSSLLVASIALYYLVPKIIALWKTAAPQPPIEPFVRYDGNKLFLVEDVSKMILSYLDERDLISMSQVSHRWYLSIVSYPPAINKLIIKSCLAAAKAQITNPFDRRDDAIGQIACFESRDNPDGALATAGKMVNWWEKTRVLGNIIVKLAVSDLKRAKKLAFDEIRWGGFNSMGGISAIVRAEAAQSGIAAAEAVVDALTDEHSDSRDIGYLQVVEIKASTDTVSAAATASKMRASYYQIEARIKIAKIGRGYGYLEVRGMVEALLNADKKYKYLLKLAKIDPNHDFEAVKAAALSTGPQHLEYKYLDIVKRQAHYNPDGAKITAGMINGYWKGVAFLEIVKVESEKNRVAARKTAETIEDLYYRGLALLHLRDFDAAKALASQIDITDRRDGLLLEIVKVEAKIDPIKARETAGTITDPFRRAHAYLDIPDLDGAITAAEMIDDNENKVSVYIRIMTLDPRHDFNPAKATVLKIGKIYHLFRRIFRFLKMSDTRSFLFGAIAEAEADFNPKAALQTALTIDNPRYQVDALIKIAETARKTLTTNR